MNDFGFYGFFNSVAVRQSSWKGVNKKAVFIRNLLTVGKGLMGGHLAVLHTCNSIRGWSGGAIMLGKLPVLGHPTVRITVGQGLTAGGVVWTFLLSSILSLLFLPLFGGWPDID